MNRKLLTLAGASLLGLAAQQTMAAVLYSNIVPQLNGSGQYYGDYGTAYNPGAYFDDVLVDLGALVPPGQQPLRISSLTFGLVQAAGSPNVTVQAYLTSVTDNPANTLFDYFQPVLTLPASAAGYQTVAGNSSGSKVFTTVTITLPSTIDINPNYTDQPGYGEFAVGLRLINTTGGTQADPLLTAWSYAQPNNVDANSDFAWDANLTANTSDGFSAPLGTPTTFALEVNGDPVPEPASLTLLAGAALLAVRRRNRAQLA